MQIIEFSSLLWQHVGWEDGPQSHQQANFWHPNPVDRLILAPNPVNQLILALNPFPLLHEHRMHFEMMCRLLP
jgi:hypothetical protein